MNKEKMVPVEKPPPVDYRDLDRVGKLMLAVEVDLRGLRFETGVLLRCAQLMTVRAEELAGALEAVAPDRAKKLISATSAIHSFSDKEAGWILKNVTQPARELAKASPGPTVRTLGKANPEDGAQGG